MTCIIPPMGKKKLVVGLTGNIASGKSSVGSVLSAHGFHVIEADRIGWELLANPDVKKRIVSSFKNVQTDEEIDRKKLGDIVFSNGANLKILNGIIHLPLLKELKHRIRKSDEAITIVNAALIFEWRIEDWFDRIILVICDEEKKIERLEKKGLTQEQALHRINSQIPESEKVQKSDFVIENNGTLQELRAKTHEIIDQIKKISRN
jgi:dephospho-CoA kinase